MILDNKTILVTGGTGSFGQKFIEYILNNKNPKSIRIFSRDEMKQWEMKRKFDSNKKLRFFIGDVRDKNRLMRAFEGVDIVVHAAALKHVPVCEYNPFEAVLTNTIGVQNIIEAALFNNVDKIRLLIQLIYMELPKCAWKKFALLLMYILERIEEQKLVVYVTGMFLVLEAVFFHYGTNKKKMDI